MVDKIITHEDIKKLNRERPALAAGFDVSYKAVRDGNIDLNRHIITGQDRKGNLRVMAGHLFPKENVPYVKSRKYHERWGRIDSLRKKINKNRKDRKFNLIEFPADYYDLIQQVVWDLTRRVQEHTDFTPLFTEEITRLNAANPMSIRQLLEFAAKFGAYVPGAPPNMVQEKTGDTDTINLDIFTVGHERTLISVLFDYDIWSMQKVLKAVARAHVGRRNTNIFNVFANTVWVASQKQAADATAGATYETKLYNTVRDARNLLEGLKDMSTKQLINTPEVYLLCENKIIAQWLNSVINGQLRDTGTNSLKILNQIAVDKIFYYRGDAWSWNNTNVIVPGCTAGKAYMFVPRSAGWWWHINKAPLTVETGRGDTLSVGQEQKVWWCADGRYYDQFIGSSKTGVAAAWAAGYGYVVEITLPAAP